MICRPNRSIQLREYQGFSWWGPSIRDNGSGVGSSCSDGQGVLLVKSGLPDLRDPDGVSVDATGKKIDSVINMMQKERQKTSPRFLFPSMSSSRYGEGFDALESEDGGARISNLGVPKNSSTPPTLAGKPLPLRSTETVHGLAIAGDRRSFLLATNGFIHSFDASGKERWKIFTPSLPWAVNVSGNSWPLS